MKGKKYILLVAMAVCALVKGVIVEAMPYSEFPLEKEAVEKALEDTGIAGNIAEDETHSNAENQITYVVRDSEKTYDGSENPAMVAGISSAITEGERFLSVVFQPMPDKKTSFPFSWEEWREQIIFATLLNGGFTDAEEVYLNFSTMDVPENEEKFEWESELKEGYCRISYSLHNLDEDSGAEKIKENAQYTVKVEIYESKALYEKVCQQTQEIRNENSSDAAN